MTNTSLLIQRNKIIKTEIKTKILKKKKKNKGPGWNHICLPIGSLHQTNCVTLGMLFNLSKL